jgi:hypothetical protein
MDSIHQNKQKLYHRNDSKYPPQESKRPYQLIFKLTLIIKLIDSYIVISYQFKVSFLLSSLETVYLIWFRIICSNAKKNLGFDSSKIRNKATQIKK